MILLLALSTSACASHESYGNDLHDIETIVSNQFEQNCKIEIFDVVVIDPCKVAGFTDAQKNLGYALFIDQGNAEYIYRSFHIEHSDAESGQQIVYDSFKYRQDDDNRRTMIVILSNDPDLARIDQIINNSEIRTITVSKNPSLTLFTEELSDPYEAIYHFYNNEGGLISVPGTENP